MPVNTVDFTFREAKIRADSRRGFLRRMKQPIWDLFFHENVQKIFEKGGTIIDIGGGLRIDGHRGNAFNKKTAARYRHFLSNPRVNYIITDYTDKYSPDFVEDIHNLSFGENTIDAIFCMAVLQHVYDPNKAASEIVRVLKKDGMAFIYVPFMYRYHAHKEDYRDYFRFSKDGISYLFRECSRTEICPIRGMLETLLKFLPISNLTGLHLLARALDNSIPRLKRISQVQTSGYHVFVVK